MISLFLFLADVDNNYSREVKSFSRAHNQEYWSQDPNLGNLTPSSHSFFFFYKFIYLFIFAVLGLRFCTWAFSSSGERGLLFVAVHRLLVAVASLVVEHGL